MSNGKRKDKLAIYLNTNKPLENYKRLLNTEYFVDKSMIMEKTNKIINTANSYICVTRPRRFGKSSVADMIGAYYSKGIDSKYIFDSLNISKSVTYKEHLNKYNVIKISFNEISEIGNTYEDYIFTNNLFEENQNDFLEFLRNLLKDQPYVALAYMTGVLPIKKYSNCESYWTNTGAMDEVAEYLKYNVLEIRDEVIEMVSGQEIDIIIDEEFRAGQGAPRTKEEIYSAMIVLGFLYYHDGYLKIPNKEIMKEFEKALTDESFGYVSML